MNLNPFHAAVVEGRTIHTRKVLSIESFSNELVLKPAEYNQKLGNGKNFIEKGLMKGFPLFSLTLEERKTCPTSCHHWRDCYGNGMAFAKRYSKGKDLENKIRNEVKFLIEEYGSIMIRLHILGDFYSVKYVRMWRGLLRKYPGLHIFGYSARNLNTPIGRELLLTFTKYKKRFMMRFSSEYPVSNFMGAVEKTNDFKSIVCPEMQGKTDSCVTCGLCWSIFTNIQFPNHDKNNKIRKNALTLEA